MESTVNFNTKLKEAASFGQPITEYDPGSRGYKDFVNLARELMGHRPVDVEPTPNEKLSRPAELVQRAKQLAQLTNFQFGRNAVSFTGGTIDPAPSRNAAVAADPAAAAMAHANGNRTIGNAHTHRHRRVSAPEPPRSSTSVPKPAKTTAAEDRRILRREAGRRRSGLRRPFRARQEGADRRRFQRLAADVHADGHGTAPAAGRCGFRFAPGRYRYRLVVDGQWMTDPNNKYVETNQFGELNNVVEVD